MKKSHNIHDNMPLHSEKVEKLLGEIPSSLILWSTAILVLIFAALAAVIMLFPYPYSNGETIFQHFLS